MLELHVCEIKEDEVRRILTMERCLPLMEKTLRDFEEGKSLQQMRTIHTLPGGNLFGFMPAYSERYFGAKVVTAFHQNQGTEYPSHLGSVLLFDTAHGALRAMADATSITAIRTGAVSGAATKLLAREDASVLALLGAGTQARSHLEAIMPLRPIQQVKIFDQFQEAAEKLAKETQAQYGVSALACPSAAEAARGADIICTVTTSKEPILDRSMVKPGAHINAVGAFSPKTREISSDLAAASRLYADSKAAMCAECGEFLIPKAEGLLDESHIVGSIGEVLLGKAPGRGSSNEITLFSALGLAVEDLACAEYCYETVKSAQA